jgi:DNA-binding GntR family transcriptional regulator
MRDEASKDERSMRERAGSTLDLTALSGDLPLGEAVFRVLRQALHDGIYRPGDRLREEEIARKLDVSRTPVREAFAKLQSKRLIEAGGTKGLIVRTLDMTEVLELYAMREILEGAAARLAAQHASSSELEVLDDLLDAFEAHRSDAGEMARLNRLFHNGIIRAARNRYLEMALDEMQDGIGLLGATTFGVADRPGTAIGEHRAILGAIRERASERAEALACAHIREALRARLKLLHAASASW